MLPLGAPLSALPIGYLADAIGRKKTLLLAEIPLITSFGLLYAFFWQPLVLYTARFLAGLGCGALFVLIPMYIGEIAEPSIRGKLVSLFELSDCIGILLTAVLGSMMNFQALTLILFFVSAAFTSLLLLVPETPVYLRSIDEVSRAKEVLKYFRGEEYGYIDREFREIEMLIGESNSKQKMKELFASESNRKGIIAGLGIMAFRQFSGIEAVIFYTVSIFMLIGDEIPPYQGTIIVYTVQMVSAYCAVRIIEKASRRFYLKLSSIVMAISLALLGIHYQNRLILEIKIFGREFLPLISLTLFIVAFTIGFGPVPLTIMSELFAPHIKAQASGLAIMTNWLSAYIVTFAFPLMTTHLGSHITFYVFSMFMVLATLFVQFFVPETKGKTLERIQIELSEFN